MKRIKETLWADYDAVSTKINTCESNNENYKTLLDERDKIRNELIKLEQSDIEAKSKRQQLEAEAKIKEAQITAENKRELIRNGITIATFIVTTMVSVAAIDKTFKFDEEGTFTSTLGKSILNGIIPKPFKR